MARWQNITLATLIAGSLDLCAAMGLTLYFGRQIGDMLRYVASGPLPSAMGWGIGGAILGGIVHFILMAIMVIIYAYSAARDKRLSDSPLLWGVVYGIITFVAMNLVVVPLRFGGWPPSMLTIVTQLFCHIVLVGLPIAFVIARGRSASV